jgi:Carboxypeptidase regulatory-like domain/Kelch motif/Viral BACON domain
MHRWLRGNRRTFLVPVSIFAFALVLLAGSSSAAQDPQNRPFGPVVTSDVRHDTSPPLRSMKAPAKARTATTKINELSRRTGPRREAREGAEAGSARVQTGITTSSMPDFEQNFEGLDNINGVLPPDTQGDVGPDHYVQATNLSFAVFDKQGNLLFGPVNHTALWEGFGGVCETFDGGDPITIYDEAADRWFTSQIAYPGGAQGFHNCMAVSATGDPTGAWHRYDFLYSPTTLNDYPKFGIWNDTYFMTANDFANGATFSGVTSQAYEREAMLAGEDARVVSFTIGDSSGIYASLLPPDAEGQALGANPPAGAPAPFVMHDDDAWGFSDTDRLLMWDFHVDWTNPANSTFGDDGEPNRFFETAPYDSNLCNYARSCIDQPGTTVGLDSLADRLLHRAAYRNLGDRQTITVTHGVDVNGNDQAGIRWYELDDSGSGWTIDDQGTFAPDSDSRWMGSSAIDASGNLAVGYSVSSSTTFPSIRVAGRLAGDPAGELAQGEISMIEGGGSQTHTASRWGDYAAMQVDPTDGCTFWFTTEYMETTSTADWQTRIGSFRFPNCTAGPHGDLTGTVTDASTGDPIADAVVSTSVASTSTDDEGQYSLTLPPGTYDVTASAFGYEEQTVTGVEVTDGGTTVQDFALDPVPVRTVSGQVRDGSGHGWPLYAKVTVDGVPVEPDYTNPFNGRYSIQLPEGDTYTLEVESQYPGYQPTTETVEVGTRNVVRDIELVIDEASCEAPGYQLNFGTPAVNEPFNSTTGPPAGWTVVDNEGNGQVWAFNDPGARGNLTGGEGNFAIVDSDDFGPSNSQDTSLVTPVLNLTGMPTPVVRFNNDYRGFPGQVGDVDVTTDGGTTWTNVWHHTGDSVRGPGVQEVALPTAAGQAAVQLRFHFSATFGWWWQVDNVAVQNRSCDPVDGGLVAGIVRDRNTGDGINGATVTSVDEPEDSGRSFATPDDPQLGDGFYWLFSSLTGRHRFTASAGNYVSQTRPATVDADWTTRLDFSLAAGRLSVEPGSVEATIRLGQSATRTFTMTNDGTAPVEVELSERPGSFVILSPDGTETTAQQIADSPGAPVRRIEGPVTDLSLPEARKKMPWINKPVPKPPPRVPPWEDIANYPFPVMDHIADSWGGQVYSVSGIDGTNWRDDVLSFDPATGAWTDLAPISIAREKPNGAIIDGKFYVVGGWDAGGTPVTSLEIYDIASDSWTTGAPIPNAWAASSNVVLDGKLYLIGGCKAACGSTEVWVYDPGADEWSAAAPYPQPASWTQCGAIEGSIYCAGTSAPSANAYKYDPAADEWTPIASMPASVWGGDYVAANGQLIISGGIVDGAISNEGFAYDPQTDTWSALPNANRSVYRGAGACGFYRVGGSDTGFFTPVADSEVLPGYDDCGVAADVPWLSVDPTTATIDPGESVVVTVGMDANVAQPGTYTASIAISENTPYAVPPVGVTMNVTPPAQWGKLMGTVEAVACNGTRTPLPGATVQINSWASDITLSTENDGTYAHWMDRRNNPLTMIVAKDGYKPQTRRTRIRAGEAVVENFALNRTNC